MAVFSENPLITIRFGRKYDKIMFDLIREDYNLHENSRKKILKFFKALKKHNLTKPNAYCYCTRTSGLIRTKKAYTLPICFRIKSLLIYANKIYIINTI